MASRSEARQFNTVDKVYDFPAEGPYTVRIVAPGYKDAQFVITANENAQLEISADVSAVRTLRCNDYATSGTLECRD